MLVIACTHCSFSTIPFSEPSNIYLTLPQTSTNLSVSEFLKFKPSDYKKLTGKRLTLKESIVLKIVQKRIKKSLKKDGTIDTLTFNKDKRPFKWHWGGFFLSLLLPFVGLLIAGLIKKDDKKWDRINSAAIGTAIISLVIIILVLRSF